MNEAAFKAEQERQRRMKGPDGPKGTLCVCAVCGDQYGSVNGQCALTCKNHKTKEQREAYYQETGQLEEL